MSTDTDCTICQDLLEEEEVSVLLCGHIYHEKCIKQWLVRSKSCPHCNQDQSNRTPIRLYYDFCFSAKQKKKIALLQEEVLDYQSSLLSLESSNETLSKLVNNLEEQLKISKDNVSALELQLEGKNEKLSKLEKKNEDIKTLQVSSMAVVESLREKVKTLSKQAEERRLECEEKQALNKELLEALYRRDVEQSDREHSIQDFTESIQSQLSRFKALERFSLEVNYKQWLRESRIIEDAEKSIDALNLQQDEEGDEELESGELDRIDRMFRQFDSLDNTGKRWVASMVFDQLCKTRKKLSTAGQTIREQSKTIKELQKQREEVKEMHQTELACLVAKHSADIAEKDTAYENLLRVL